MIEHAICFLGKSKKKQNANTTQHNTTTKNNNNNNKCTTKKTKTLEIVTILLKSKQISSVCKPYFFYKTSFEKETKDNRLVNWRFSDGWLNKTPICVIFTYRSRIHEWYRNKIDMVGLCNLTTSDCSDREIVPIRKPRVILNRPEAGKWWLELNEDEIFVRKRKGSLVGCHLAVDRTCYRCR